VGDWIKLCLTGWIFPDAKFPFVRRGVAACEGEKIADGNVAIVHESVDGMSGLLLGELNFAVRFVTLIEEGLSSFLHTLFGLRKDAGLSAQFWSIRTPDNSSFHPVFISLSRLRILQITLKFASLPKPKEENVVFFCKYDLRLYISIREEEETADLTSSSWFPGDCVATFGSRYGGGDLMFC